MIEIKLEIGWDLTRAVDVSCYACKISGNDNPLYVVKRHIRGNGSWSHYFTCVSCIDKLDDIIW